MSNEVTIMLTRRIFLVFLLSVLLTVSAFAADTATYLDNVSVEIDNKRLENALAILDKIEPVGMEDSLISRWHFLYGKATFIKVSKDIKECRDEGTLEPGKLNDDQIPPLEKSLAHFFESYKLAPTSEWAVEALYATAVIQDYSCLQRFKGAAESYRLVAEKFPETQLGKLAKRKYDSLKTSIDAGPHGGQNMGGGKSSGNAHSMGTKKPN
jgi:hypothetical protein